MQLPPTWSGQSADGVSSLRTCQAMLHVVFNMDLNFQYIELMIRSPVSADKPPVTFNVTSEPRAQTSKRAGHCLATLTNDSSEPWHTFLCTRRIYMSVYIP